MKRRGGVGHDLSHIRPTSSPVMNSALTSTGVVPFMERYSNSTREVAQDGRRGALMLSISIKHPDSENFIDAKTEKGKVTGANVSVKITDEFMQAVITGSPLPSSFRLIQTNPLMSKRLMPESYGVRSFTMPGSLQSQGYYFGIRLFASRFRILTLIWDFERFRQTHVVRFLFVRMIRVGCWQ
jgi:hypothetical protein